MHRQEIALVLAGALLLGFPTRADDSVRSVSGLEIAFRTGLQIPLGWETQYTQLSDLGLQWPLWVDLGYRWDKVFLGASGQYAFAPSTSVSNCTSCFAVRTGFVAQLHPAGHSSVDPWIGLGFGYEWQHLSSSFTLHGWDFLRVGGGCDFRFLPGFSIGPFAEVSIGEFTHVGSTELPFKALHYWLTLGLKVTGFLEL
jgi:hypothetical protein